MKTSKLSIEVMFLEILDNRLSPLNILIGNYENLHFKKFLHTDELSGMKEKKSKKKSLIFLSENVKIILIT